MKIGIYTDAHFSVHSSILTGSSNSLQGRLSHLIDSFQWMYKVFEDNNVDLIIDIGDLADKATLTSAEITAISKAIKFNSTIPEYHVLGNHDRQSEDGSINAIEFVELMNNHHLINSITKLENNITLIPYGYYKDEDFNDLESTKYAFTHIDIIGSDLGTGWSLKTGVSPTTLAKKFDIVINGHIHNYSVLYEFENKKIINFGSISGQNFSSKGTPHIGILDTNNDEINFFDNPHALYFETAKCDSLSEVITFINKLPEDVTHAVRISIPQKLAEDTRKIINNSSKVVASKIQFQIEKGKLSEESLKQARELEQINSVSAGFSKLREFLENSEKLPYDKDSIMSIIKELEVNKEE